MDIWLADESILLDWIRIYNKYGEEGINNTHNRSHYLLHDDRLDKSSLDSIQDISKKIVSVIDVTKSNIPFKSRRIILCRM